MQIITVNTPSGQHVGVVQVEPDGRFRPVYRTRQHRKPCSIVLCAHADQAAATAALLSFAKV